MAMSRSGESMGLHTLHGRVIVHADLDCFYCQVEHVRLGIPISTPLAVQQWDGLIAVNYEARKFGVKRGDRTEVAKKKCPEITLVHVETIGTSDLHLAGRNGTATDHATTTTSIGATHDQRSCKVSLERYRVASFAIMSIFQSHCRRVERASIDEAYLDLTEEAAKLCQDMEAGKAPDLANAPDTDLQGTAGHRVDPTNAFDRALLAGARLTAAMRLAVEHELGFTVSAGIASNKVLAKLASSRNKPNKQTVVPAGAASEMLDTVPLQHVRGLGGKLGESIAAWSKAETASDLKNFDQGELMGKFGPKTGEWLWRICRGMDDEAVTPNLKPKSLSVCKSFAPIRDRETVLQWIRLLCKELAQRISMDRGAWGRRATKLTLQIISSKQGTEGGRANSTHMAKEGWRAPTYTRSRTIDIPGGTESPTAEALVSEAMSVFDKTKQALPCSRLALTAHEFGGLVSGRGSIASFLRSVPTEEKQEYAISVPTSCHAQKPFWSGGADKGANSSSSLSSAEKKRGSVRSYFNSDGANSVMKNVTANVVAATATSGVSNDHSTIVGGSLSTVLDGSGTRKTTPTSFMSGVIPATERESGDKGGEASCCAKCGKSIRADVMREHLDFHYAEGLQERYSQEVNVAGGMAAVNRTPDASKGSGSSSTRQVEKRKRDEGGRESTPSRSGVGRRASRAGNARPTTRIDSFFKPL